MHLPLLASSLTVRKKAAKSSASGTLADPPPPPGKSSSASFSPSIGKRSRRAKRRSPQNFPPRFPQPLRLAALSVAGFTSALVAWEGILHLTVEASQGMNDHPALGKIDNPGQMIHTKEGFTSTKLNSLGMRAKEPTPKSLGEYRILMLGDSFTRADEVNDGISFSDRLQADFTDAQPPNQNNRPITETVQVINAGKPSASPASYLYAADFHKQTFTPDSTVVQLTESDFTMDMNNEFSEFYLEKQDESGYKIKHNKTFGSADPLAQALIEKVPGVRSLMQLSTLRVGGRNLSGSLSSAASELTEDSADLSPEEALKAETALEAEDAAMVRWTVQQLNRQFPNLVIVFIPAMNYQDFGTTSSEPRNTAIENALTLAATDQGVPLLNMREDFLAHYRKSGTNLKGFNNTVPGEGHLNAEGHKLVAKRLTHFYSQPDSPLRRS